ncbi:Cyclic pyranopterin monophosphate synthase [Frankliniella fusca]|uniref:Regulatory protein zeste n=1 Tax=Frankliniella fusca TaxID=407009 RepID=A0AAE1GWI8_9NEOP|nr:Cyclic pyranopterin monophosphate synthase [Frankliniella fusca]
MADAMEDGATQRVTMKQREVMVAFMQDNNALATGRFTTSDGAKQKARLTKEFSDKLNAVADGATKTPDKWMKSWQDWKSDVKKKAGKIKRHFTGTGGGPPCRLQLTPLEEQVIEIMGQGAAQKELQHQQVNNAVELVNPEQIAPGSTVVLHSFLLNEVMDVDVDVMGATTTAVTIPLPKPSPTTSESTELSTEADNESLRSQRKRKKSECRSVSRSMETMENMRNTTEALNRQTNLKETRYQLELRKFELELAREERQARKEEQELELARQSAEASVKVASAMEAMAPAVTAAMQTFQCYLQNK